MDGTIIDEAVQINGNPLQRSLPGLFPAVILCPMEERESKARSGEVLEAPHPTGAPPGLREHLAAQEPVRTGVSTPRIVADAEGVLEEQVVVARDVAGLFRALCRIALDGGDRVALPEPGRPEFVDGILSAGARYVDPGRGAQWEVRVDAMDRLLEDGELSMVVLGRPCAPAGTMAPIPCIQRCLDAGLVVVVDESWLPFSGPDEQDLSPLLARPEGQRLVLLRCMGLSWGLDQHRAGFALTGSELAEELRGPHPAGDLPPGPDATLRWMMEDPRRRGEHAGRLRRARQEALETLEDLPGLEVLPCGGPWLALRAPGLEGEELSGRLGGFGIPAQWRPHWSWRDAVALPVPPPGQGGVVADALRQILWGS